MSSKDWLILSVITFLTVAGWVVYDVYHAAITSTVTPVQEELTRPLDPSFNTDVLDSLKGREK